MKVVKLKRLSEEEWEEVKKWELKNNIDSSNANRIRREFSDVYPLAIILKDSLPKLVDMNNYPKKNAVNLKRQNWDTFNFKVLEKIGISLRRELIESITDCVCGAIELVFLEIDRAMKKAKLAEERALSMKQQDIWKQTDDVKIVVVNKQVGDGIVQAPQKMILFSMYEDVSRQLREKEDLLRDAIATNKILIKIGKVKSDRIAELRAQIDKHAGTSSTLATAINGQEKASAATGAVKVEGQSDLKNEQVDDLDVEDKLVICDKGNDSEEKPQQKDCNGKTLGAEIPYTLLPIPKMIEVGSPRRLSAIIESALTGSVSNSSTSNSKL